MAEGEIKEQLENWKETHPEAITPVAAPDKPCYACQMKAIPDLDKDKPNLLLFRDVAFNMAYDNLKKEGSKVVLITEDQCPPCEDAAQVFDALIKEGAIEILPYSKCTQGDKDCIAAEGIKAVPVLAARDAEGKIKKFFPLAGPSTAVPLKGDAHAV